MPISVLFAKSPRNGRCAVSRKLSPMSEELVRRSGVTPSISVIMTVYNAAHYMERSLPPLMEMLKDGSVSEIIVVDDCSTEASTAELAHRCDVRTIRTPRNGGPGAARNLAAKDA